MSSVNIDRQPPWSIPLLYKNRSIGVQTKTRQVILRHSLVKHPRVELILRKPLVEVRMGGTHSVVVVVKGEVW